MTSRRSFLLGLGAALAAPAIVRAELIMPVRSLVKPAAPSIDAMLADAAAMASYPGGWLPCDGRSLSRALYSELFQVMGLTYGAADDKSFNLPNLLNPPMRGPHEHSIASNFIIKAKSDTFEPVGALGVMAAYPPCQPIAKAAVPSRPHGPPLGYPLWLEE